MSILPVLGADAVATIRKELTPHNAQALAIRFDVSIITLQSAVKGRGAYARYTTPPPMKWIRQKSRSSLSDDDKNAIKNLVKKKAKLGLTLEKIGKMYGKSAGYIHQIASGIHD